MKPSLPKGTRDFGPFQIRKRNYIFDILRTTFELYGYQPIETPAMENLSTLMGKYGDEGDQLLFKILNNGDFLARADKQALEAGDSAKALRTLSKRGLRYDLTVPFARFLSMNRNELPSIFKRYQMQPVWRADRPQKGRFQEFYQCDADVAGSDSLVFESELIEIYDKVFSRLGIEVSIRINHRKILMALAEAGGMEKNFMQFTTALDKWDKTGSEGFIRELSQQGFDEIKIGELVKVLKLGFDDTAVQKLLASSESGLQALKEIDTLKELGGFQNRKNEVKIDLTLARGLSYYTGFVFEVEAPDSALGSLGGGGRYDDLTGIFDYKGISGVGISFGAERIYELMEEKGLFPSFRAVQSKVLFMPLDEKAVNFCRQWCRELRELNIPCEMYPEPTKLKKQFRYAEQIEAPLVALVGEMEMQENTVTVKNQISGEQQKYRLNELAALINQV